MDDWNVVEVNGELFVMKLNDVTQRMELFDLDGQIVQPDGLPSKASDESIKNEIERCLDRIGVLRLFMKERVKE
jgi:hypothetical protein